MINCLICSFSASGIGAVAEGPQRVFKWFLKLTAAELRIYSLTEGSVMRRRMARVKLGESAASESFFLARQLGSGRGERVSWKDCDRKVRVC
ncbi:hypothetical protein Tco_1549694 [Tanacetum coccineum]